MFENAHQPTFEMAALVGFLLVPPPNVQRLGLPLASPSLMLSICLAAPGAVVSGAFCFGRLVGRGLP